MFDDVCKKSKDSEKILFLSLVGSGQSSFPKKFSWRPHLPHSKSSTLAAYLQEEARQMVLPTHRCKKEGKVAIERVKEGETPTNQRFEKK